MNLRELDLNLVVALDALLRHQSVTLAAQELGLSQPAMSQALARLRDALGDPLLIRQGRGLVPTAAARAMTAPIAAALRSLDGALFPGDAFDPADATGVITLAAGPYYQEALVPRLVQALQLQAPRLQLHALPLRLDELGQALSAGRLDLALCPGHLALEGVEREVLVSDTYRCVLRREHPAGRRRLTLQDCGRLGQVLLSPGGPWASELAQALRGDGFQPRFALVTEQLGVALDVVARTDCYAVLPRRMAEQYRGERLRVLSPPVELGTCTDALVWHPRTADVALWRWVRELVTTLTRNVYSRRRL